MNGPFGGGVMSTHLRVGGELREGCWGGATRGEIKNRWKVYRRGSRAYEDFMEGGGCEAGLLGRGKCLLGGGAAGGDRRRRC